MQPTSKAQQKEEEEEVIQLQPKPTPAPLEAPKMMANPVVASDEEAKLLNLLQEEAKKSDAAQREVERRAFAGE